MFSFLRFSNAEREDQEKGKAKPWLILLFAAIGVLLILFGGGLQKKEETEPAPTEYNTEQDEVLIYQQYLEERVEALCRSVKGVGNVTAIVTLSGGYESVYATEIKDGDEEYVIIGSGSGASALFLSKETPEIAGIGIVCVGGASPDVKRELTALISASFHISTNRIYVTEARE